MNIILLGAPASGKGTQSEKIIKEFNFFHISTGDIIRSNINNQTEYGIKCQKYVKKGKLVPYSLIINMVSDFLKTNSDKEKIIWDGFPRTEDQAKELDKILLGRNAKIDIVFYLKIKQEAVIDRITSRVVCSKCKRSYNLKYIKPKIENRCDYDNSFLVKRSDDDISKLKTRLEAYELETKKLLSYYNDKIIEIDSEKDKEDIWKNIKGFISDYN